ncbi:MAG: UbiD family decarboxylase, partial [Planctomycetota bacterium]|nr:UbiD family decarboxylase [Planctomycetota bacterium]
MSTAPHDLQSFLRRLRSEGELVEVQAEVDPDLEVAEIHRCVIAANGPALLFTNV